MLILEDLWISEVELSNKHLKYVCGFGGRAKVRDIDWFFSIEIIGEWGWNEKHVEYKRRPRTPAWNG